MLMQSPVRLSVENSDHWSIVSTQFLASTSKPKAIILFNGGTCILQNYYADFCTWLAAQNYIVYSYDYRGQGLSLGNNISDPEITIVNWAQKDMTAMLNHIHVQHPTLPKYIVAHSMGGQILGLCPKMHLVEKIVTISSSYGNWRFYSKRKWATGFFTQWMFPIFTRFKGYVPMKSQGFGEDYPKGVANELTQWYRYKLSFSKLMDKFETAHTYDQITQPFKAIFIADDFIASEHTIPYYQSDYQNAALEIEMIQPEDFALDKIGHMGFFRKKHSLLWDRVGEFLI